MTSFKEPPELRRRRLMKRAANSSDAVKSTRKLCPATLHGLCNLDLADTWRHRRRRDPRQARARADGGRQRAGLPPAGPPLRRRARVLGDGLGGRDPAPERADARLPARRAPTSTRSRSRSSAPTRCAMAEAARMVEAAGADIVDINFGCPVKKVTKTGAGASLLDDPDHACRIVEAVAGATPLPVSVKMRRGVANGSRTCLVVGPRLVGRRAASLTLHPRSAKQMYTGTADHALTAELVSLVDVPVIASGDVTSRARAQAVLATTGASAVMVGRAAQGNPWALAEIVGRRSRAVARGGRRRAAALHARDGARARRAARDRLPEEVLRLVPRPRPLSAAVQAGARDAPDARRGRAAPLRRSARRALHLRAAAPRRARPENEVLLDSLPISIYGGG